MSKQHEIVTFTKNHTTDIKMSLIQENGEEYLDIRQCAIGRESERIPTSKGVRFNLIFFDKFKKGVEDLQEYIDMREQFNKLPSSK